MGEANIFIVCCVTMTVGASQVGFHCCLSISLANSSDLKRFCVFLMAGNISVFSLKYFSKLIFVLNISLNE